METFIALVIIIGAILQIILFFKIWGMTNDVSEILGIMRERNVPNTVKPVQQQFVQSSAPEVNPSNEANPSIEEIKYSVGEKVFYYGKELIITGDNGDGTYSCSDSDGDPYSASMEWQKIKRMN